MKNFKEMILRALSGNQDKARSNSSVRDKFGSLLAKRLHIGTSADNGHVIYHLKPSIIEFSGFPVINYYIEKYRTYPSILNCNHTCDYDELIEKIGGLKLNFYTDTSADCIEYNEDPPTVKFNFKNFMAFDHYSSGLVFHIDIKPNYPKKDRNVPFNIDVSCLYNPNTHPNIYEDVMGILPEKKTASIGVELGNLNILVIENGAFSLQENKITCPDINLWLYMNLFWSDYPKKMLRGLSC